MIDKVDLRVPRTTGFSREFDSIYREFRGDPKGPFRESKLYAASADLREYGFPALLHTYCKRDKEGNHKLELIDTGQMGLSQMRTQVERIFAVDSGRLGLMRLDLTADVPGVSVGWFEQHIIAKWKRRTCSIGELREGVEFCELGTRGLETFYLGRRPNVFRIYNKIAELMKQYRLMVRRTKKAERADLPGFEAVHGYPASGFVLTRVERQIGGCRDGRLPCPINSFRELRRAADFNPFEKLQFVAGGSVEPNPDDFEFEMFCAGMHLRQQAERWGTHRLKQWINQHSTRNGARVMEKYAAFMPASEGITHGSDPSRFPAWFETQPLWALPSLSASWNLRPIP
jgi:hypothetical protein